MRIQQDDKGKMNTNVLAVKCICKNKQKRTCVHKSTIKHSSSVGFKYDAALLIYLEGERLRGGKEGNILKCKQVFP